MKSENENCDDEAFERELARFRRVAPPDRWRDDLIANAIPGWESAPVEKARVFPPRSSERLFAGVLAAAWLVIFSLWIATPDDFQSAKTSHPTLPTAPGSIQARPFSMLAWRFAGGEPGEELSPKTP